MAGEIAIPFSAYAAVEADEALRVAELAERRAFVNGYSHATATPDERQRYIESIGILYPQAAPQQMPVEGRRTTGAIIILLFALFSVCAFVGWLRGDVEDGIFAGVQVVAVLLIAALAIGLFLLGCGLLFS